MEATVGSMFNGSASTATATASRPRLVRIQARKVRSLAREKRGSGSSPLPYTDRGQREVVTPVMVKGREKFAGTGGQNADCRQWWAPLERRGFRRGTATGRVAPRTWLVRGVPHMDRLARRLGLKTDPTIFFVSAGLM